MKILYFANIRLPTEKVHGYQIIGTCAALKQQGVDVELVVADRRNPTLSGRDPFAYYGVSPRFPVHRLPCLDLIGTPWHRVLGPVAFWLQTATFAKSVRNFLVAKDADWVYCRDELVLKVLGPIRQRFAVELHALPKPKYRALLRRADRIIVITQAIKDGLIKQGLTGEKIIVAPDAADLPHFSDLPSRDTARAQLGWSTSRKIAVYTGHPYPWKGVFRLAEASKLLLDDWRVVMVGGSPNDLKPLQNYVANDKELQGVQLISHQERKYLPLYRAAADVLVIPNTPESDRSRLYTSPMKLFEYLAAGRPIVASDLPSIREVVSEREVIFVKPDDPKDLARGIREAGESDQAARVSAALALAKRYTWEARAKTIFDFLSALPKR